MTSKKIVININESCTPTVPVSQSPDHKYRPKRLRMTNPGFRSFSTPGTSQEYELKCGPDLEQKKLKFSSPGFSQTHTQRQDLFVDLWKIPRLKG